MYLEFQILIYLKICPTIELMHSIHKYLLSDKNVPDAFKEINLKVNNDFQMYCFLKYKLLFSVNFYCLVIPTYKNYYR